MNWWKAAEKTYTDTAEAVEDMPAPSFRRLAIVGLAVNGYLLGSLSYFAYKGGKAVIKAIENRK